jgi:hypothetical protein
VKGKNRMIEWSDYPQTIPADERERLLGLYASGYDEVMSALDSITDAEWDKREADGEWSVREIVHHLGDSEMNAASRIRMLVADEAPVIQGYDQEGWTRKLYTAERPLDLSVIAFKAARDATAPLLRLLTEEDWAKSGIHTEAGPMTAITWLTMYGPHAHDHADQIRRARRA